MRQRDRQLFCQAVLLSERLRARATPNTLKPAPSESPKWRPKRMPLCALPISRPTLNFKVTWHNDILGHVLPAHIPLHRVLWRAGLLGGVSPSHRTTIHDGHCLAAPCPARCCQKGHGTRLQPSLCEQVSASDSQGTLHRLPGRDLSAAQGSGSCNCRGVPIPIRQAR